MSVNLKKNHKSWGLVMRKQILGGDLIRFLQLFIFLMLLQDSVVESPQQLDCESGIDPLQEPWMWPRIDTLAQHVLAWHEANPHWIAPNKVQGQMSMGYSLSCGAGVLKPPQWRGGVLAKQQLSYDPNPDILSQVNQGVKSVAERLSDHLPSCPPGPQRKKLMNGLAMQKFNYWGNMKNGNCEIISRNFLDYLNKAGFFAVNPTVIPVVFHLQHKDVPNCPSHVVLAMVRQGFQINIGDTLDQLNGVMLIDIWNGDILFDVGAAWRKNYERAFYKRLMYLKSTGKIAQLPQELDEEMLARTRQFYINFKVTHKEEYQLLVDNQCAPREELLKTRAALGI